MVMWRVTIFILLISACLMAMPPLYHFSKGNLSSDEPLPPAQKADAVMVFTGSSDRLVEGYEAYLEGIARKIMVTGRDFPTDAQEPEVRQLSKKIRRKDIFVETAAENTIENAEEGAEWALRNHIKSIVLITTENHMPRAYFELRRLLPDSVKVYTDPVPGGSRKYSKVDSEKSRLFCRLYETATDTDFCYKTREIVRSLGM